MRSVVLAGNFPPPLTGQTISTGVVAELLDLDFDTTHVNLGASAAVPDGIGGWAFRAGEYVRASRLIPRITASSSLLWASASPTLPGLLRDSALYRRIWQSPAAPKLAISHWGNFETAFTGPRRIPASRIYADFDGIVVLTELLRKKLEQVRPPCPVHVVPNTLRSEMEASPEQLQATLLRRTHELERGHIHMGFVGRLLRSKGFDTVMHAASSVQDLGLQVHCHLIGPDGSATDQAYLQELSTQLNLRSTVIRQEFTHPKPLSEAIRSLHLIALPSRYEVEAQPLVLLEGMANGAVPVASDQGGIRETLAPTSGGYVSSLVGFPDFVTQLAARYADAPSLWEDDSRMARARYDDEFSRSTVRQRWRQLLR